MKKGSEQQASRTPDDSNPSADPQSEITINNIHMEQIERNIKR